MKFANYTLLAYSALLSLIIISGAAVETIQTGNPWVFVLFLPVLVYLFLHIIKPNRGHRLLLYYSFIITTIMAVSGFIGQKSEPELISAIIFLPLAFFFWLRVLPKRGKRLDPIEEKETTKEESAEVVTVPTQPEEPETPEVDVDRRTFIKLVGSVGLGVLFLTLFTRKVENTFFGNRFAPTPDSTSLADVTINYKISEIDDSNPAYFGFIDKSGKWYIMKETDTGSFRYKRGDKDFTQNWKIRASLDYGLYDSAF